MLIVFLRVPIMRKKEVGVYTQRTSICEEAQLIRLYLPYFKKHFLTLTLKNTPILIIRVIVYSEGI